MASSAPKMYGHVKPGPLSQPGRRAKHPCLHTSSATHTLMTMISQARARSLWTTMCGATQTVTSSPESVNCQQMRRNRATTMRRAQCCAIHDNPEQMIHSLLKPCQHTIARQHLRRYEHIVTTLTRATAA